jgi:hypothetical protein
MMARFNTFLLTPLAVALALTVAPPARAAVSFDVATLPSGARVMLNGRPVAELRTANQSLAPRERAGLAVQRLRAFLASGGQPIAIQPRLMEEGAGVYAGETLVLVATFAEAESQRVTTMALAEAWARDLRAALTLPPRVAGGEGSKGEGGHRPKGGPAKVEMGKPTARPAPSVPRSASATSRPLSALQLTPRELVIPVGENRWVRVTAAGPVAVETGDTGTVAAEVDAAGGKGATVTVRGLAPGKVTLRVTGGGAAAELPVLVVQHAGRIAANVAATVTGRPCPAAFAREAGIAALRDAIAVEPSATVTLGSPVGPDAAIEPGRTGTVQVPVTITGAGYLPVERTVTVPITNRALPAQESRVLLYSNNPESLTATGSLFLGALENEVPARLLYHHQNMMGRPLYVRVDLIHIAGETERGAAEILVTEGAAGPSWDTVMVGHRATARYVQNSRQEVGTVISLRPGTRRTIVSQRLADKLAVSGLFGLRLLTAKGRTGRVLVEVVADESPIAGTEVATEMARRPLSEHVYTTIRKELKARFTVGGNWTFINVGKKAVRNRDDAKRLDGNYGILYDIAVEVSNPTRQERVVSVALSPDAGAAMGVFLIDGTLVEAPPVSPPSEAVLTSFRLQPGEQRTVPIQTIPVGGSAYPISLVVRAAPATMPVVEGQ